MAGCDCQHADDGDTRRRCVDGRRTLCLSRCVRAGFGEEVCGAVKSRKVERRKKVMAQK